MAVSPAGQLQTGAGAGAGSAVLSAAPAVGPERAGSSATAGGLVPINTTRTEPASAAAAAGGSAGVLASAEDDVGGLTSAARAHVAVSMDTLRALAQAVGSSRASTAAACKDRQEAGAAGISSRSGGGASGGGGMVGSAYVPRARGPKIYVYELPPNVTTW